MKKTNYYFHTIALLLFIASLTSCSRQEQSIQLDPDQKLLTNSSTQIGDNIFEIFEDKEGNLWFGTSNNGVVKYDGTQIKYITEKDGLCGNTVANIAEDRDGNLWFGTYRDMCILDPKSRQNNIDPAFIPFSKTNGIPMLGYGWKNVKTDKNGDLWVNSHHGIFRFEGNSLQAGRSNFTEFKVPINTIKFSGFCNTPGEVSMDLVDSKNNYWFGTDGDGAYKYDGNSFTHFTIEDGLSSNNITNIIEDDKGRIWFTCIRSTDRFKGDGGLCRYDGTSFTRFPDKDGLNDNIHTIYKDRSGDIWIGATGVGLYRYMVSKEEFTFYNEPQEVVISNNVYIDGLQSILEDKNSTLWLGYSGGLFKLENNSIVNVTKEGPWK